MTSPPLNEFVAVSNKVYSFEKITRAKPGSSLVFNKQICTHLLTFRDEVLSGLKGRGLTKKDVDDALTYLSDEGHIYATMDEDHFKTTDD